MVDTAENFCSHEKGILFQKEFQHDIGFGKETMSNLLTFKISQFHLDFKTTRIVLNNFVPCWLSCKGAEVGTHPWSVNKRKQNKRQSFTGILACQVDEPNKNKGKVTTRDESSSCKDGSQSR